MDNKLQGQNLKKTYKGRNVVDQVSIEISQGEIIGLLGPNGAGKTTTFYMMVGLIRPDEGHIYLNNDDITERPIHVRARNKIGYLPQEASIFRDLTVEENILAVLEYLPMVIHERKAILEELLATLRISHIRKSKGKDLSGGERRRVEIARTLSFSPHFILLDEPFAGVDPLAINDIQNVIKDLKKRNIGILITDHNVRETLGIVDRAFIMNDGKIIVHGSPENILNNELARTKYLGSEFTM